MNKNYSDKATFIKAVRDGDPAVFKYLRVKYYGVIHDMVIKNSGNDENAKELYDEGIEGLIVMLNRPGIELTCQPGGLLFTICSKKWKKILRKRKSRRKYEQSVNEPGYDEEIGIRMKKDLQSEIFWESYEKLEDVCRMMFKYLLEKKSIKEIADIMGWNYPLAYKKVERCNRAILSFVKDHPRYTEAVGLADSSEY